ncbi:MAG: coenzyme F420-0:L-glutamate ligase [Actinomycetota bacterium]|nr:coenzyme F420-0:L-glutamate ligase [Actinomycetota bacterium]
MSARELRVRQLAGFPQVREGDRIGALIAAAAEPEPSGNDVIVISQKVVSKAEGRLRRLDRVEPGERALQLAAETGKDPALVELVLSESRDVIRAAPGVLITETKGGWICANAGIDSSNVPEAAVVTLLPEDADASARRIRAELRKRSGSSPAVVVADSFGRPWRLGQTDVALGCAGIAALDDWRGRSDAHGRELASTAIAVIDELAAAVDLVRDKDSDVPGAIVEGLGHLVSARDGPGARELQRPAAEDLFR